MRSEINSIFPIVSLLLLIVVLCDCSSNKDSGKSISSDIKPGLSYGYASLVNGTPVFAEASRTSKQTGTVDFGKKVDILSDRSVKYKEIYETWVYIRLEGLEGWCLQYFLNDTEIDTKQAKQILSETSWRGYYNNHDVRVDFATGGKCEVQFCDASQEVYDFMTGDAPDGYSWSQNGENISVSEVFGNESKPFWYLTRSGDYRLTGDIELFRPSPLYEAVTRNDMHALYTLLANGSFDEEDFDYYQYQTPEYTTDEYPAEEEQVYAPEEVVTDENPYEEGEEGGIAEYGYPVNTCACDNDDGIGSVTCNCPKSANVWHMPLLAIALYEEKYQAARVLADHGASPDGEVTNIGSGTSQPMLFYFLRTRHIFAVGFLYNNQANLGVTDSNGRNLNDLYADLVENGEKRYIRSERGANLYDAPSTVAAVLASIPLETAVVYIGELEKDNAAKTVRWAYVVWENLQGWVEENALKE